tara:strand:+ start:354 stop:491 length:138 start_codon:yes stop_codon:yes gene_type:complete
MLYILSFSCYNAKEAKMTELIIATWVGGAAVVAASAVVYKIKQRF